MSQEIHWYTIEQGVKPLLKRRVQRLLQLVVHPADLFLLLRIFLWSLVLPALKRVVPVRRLAPFLWSKSARERTHIQEMKIAAVVRWIYIFIFPGDTSCLQRSLLLYRYLSKNNSDPVLVTGMRRTEDQNWKGHAWILVDGKPFGESAATIQDFQPLITFGTQGIMKQVDSTEPTQ